VDLKRQLVTKQHLEDEHRELQRKYDDIVAKYDVMVQKNAALEKDFKDMKEAFQKAEKDRQDRILCGQIAFRLERLIVEEVFANKRSKYNDDKWRGFKARQGLYEIERQYKANELQPKESAAWESLQQTLSPNVFDDFGYFMRSAHQIKQIRVEDAHSLAVAPTITDSDLAASVSRVFSGKAKKYELQDAQAILKVLCSKAPDQQYPLKEEQKDDDRDP